MSPDMIGADEMKERAAYQAASAGQQSVESSGTAAVPPFVEAEKPRAKRPGRPAGGAPGKVTLTLRFADFAWTVETATIDAA